MNRAGRLLAALGAVWIAREWWGWFTYREAKALARRRAPTGVCQPRSMRR